MEQVVAIWQIGIIALVAGALIGALSYRLFAPSLKQADKTQGELDAARRELDSYKASVDRHFDKTSELVNDLTQNYARVYQHLAEGAQSLGHGKAFTRVLEQHQGRVSITVDANPGDADKAVDDLVAEPVVNQAAPVEAAGEQVVITDELAVTADESDTPDAEGFGTPGAVSESEKSVASETVGDTGATAGVREPVLNIDALQEAANKKDDESRLDTVGAGSESTQKKAVAATTH